MTNPFTKTANESTIFDFDFKNFREVTTNGETLSGPVVSYTAIVGSGTLTIGTPAVSTSKVTVRISGGTTGDTYTIRCRVTTSAGNTLEGVCNMNVKDIQS